MALYNMKIISLYIGLKGMENKSKSYNFLSKCNMIFKCCKKKKQPDVSQYKQCLLSESLMKTETTSLIEVKSFDTALLNI